MTIQLYKGDCLEVMKQIPDNSVDCVITDPPYKILGNGFSCPAGRLKNRDIFQNDIQKMKDGNYRLTWSDSLVADFSEIEGFVIMREEN